MSLAAWTALLIAALLPTLALGLIYRLDLYKTGTFRFVLLAFGWGGIAYLLAARINPFLLARGWVGYLDMVRYTAPVLEEALKALVLIWLVRRPSFTYFVDGAIYGFAAGIGFAILENFEYVLASPGAELLQAVSRVISTNLIHATGSAVIGIALGLARFERRPRKAATLGIGVLGAILLHVGYNNLVTRVGGMIVLLYAAAAGLGGAGLIAWAIRRGLREEEAWIQSTLGSDAQISVQEKRALTQEALGERRFLAPVAARFGPEKAARIGRLLETQARLGVLRMTAQKLSDEAMRQATRAQVERLEREMLALRAEIGMYAMLYLRGTYLRPGSDLWRQVQDAVERQSRNRQPGGLDVWKLADRRIAAEKNPDPEPPERVA